MIITYTARPVSPLGETGTADVEIDRAPTSVLMGFGLANESFTFPSVDTTGQGFTRFSTR